MSKVLTNGECDELYNIFLELNRKTSSIKKQFPIFYKYIILMLKNIEICISENYDSIGELTIYLREDWKSIFKKEKAMESFHITSSDIDEKASKNLEIQNFFWKIDKILETNLYEVQLLLKRNWYSRDELRVIGGEFEKIKDQWEKHIEEIETIYGVHESLISEVDDDIWMYAKYLSLASDDESLKKWFFAEIPAYRYLVPIEIIRLDNGKNIIRNFLLSTHTY